LSGVSAFVGKGNERLITFRLAVAAKVISSAFGVKEIGKEIKVKNSYAPTGFFTLATRGEMPSLFPPGRRAVNVMASRCLVALAVRSKVMVDRMLRPFSSRTTFACEVLSEAANWF
jgi:hypothetical protein